MNKKYDIKKQILFLIFFLLKISDIFSQTGDIFSHSYIDFLWQKTISNYLNDSLWTDKNIYDAGIILMVPLHYAYKNNEKNYQKEFQNLFKRSYPHISSVSIKNKKGLISLLQYEYLISEYLVLNYPQKNRLSEKFFLLLYNHLDTIWNYKSDYTWTAEVNKKYYNNLKHRLYFILDSVKQEPNYWLALRDDDIFVFSIAADLKYYLIQNHKDTSDLLNEIVFTGFYALKKRTSWIEVDSSGNIGWLIDLGYYSNHRDYVYAGYKGDPQKAKKTPVNGIGWDVSHSRRFPVWLLSFKRIADIDSNKIFIEKALFGLEEVFYNKVLVQPTDTFPYYLTNNYMTGENGYYRLNYVTMKKNDGYPPYHLSSTLYKGWWGLLGTTRMKNVYKEIASYYPISEDLRSFIDDRSTRKKNYYIENSLENGLAQLLAILSYKMQKE